MSRRFRVTLAVAVAILPAAPALATDYKELSRPEIVRSLLVSPERRAQIRCAGYLASVPATDRGVADEPARAFGRAVLRRLAAEVGSEQAALEVMERDAARYAASPFGSEPMRQERLDLGRAACIAFKPALDATSDATFEKLLGPIPSGPIPLPDAPECLAAFEADRTVRKPGNDLATDMIDHLATGVTASGDVAQAKLDDWRKRFRNTPPNASKVEEMTVTCLPAVAALTRQP